MTDLEREREFARMVNEVVRATAERDAGLAREARLHAALQPFADFDPGRHLADDYPYYSSPQDGIKVGHFRAAKAALEET